MSDLTWKQVILFDFSNHSWHDPAHNPDLPIKHPPERWAWQRWRHGNVGGANGYGSLRDRLNKLNKFFRIFFQRWHDDRNLHVGWRRWEREQQLCFHSDCVNRWVSFADHLSGSGHFLQLTLTVPCLINPIGFLHICIPTSFVYPTTLLHIYSACMERINFYNSITQPFVQGAT